MSEPNLSYDSQVRVSDCKGAFPLNQRITRARLPHLATTSRRHPTSHLVAGAVSLLLLGAGPLGTELRQDGYSLRPPREFTMARMELFKATRAGAMSASPSVARMLSAALVDRPGQDSASMLVAVVDGSFQATPAGRDEFSTAVVRHFSDELRLVLAMDRAELITGGAPRVEVFGTVRHEGQLRNVVVAGMAGKGRHAVITFSLPTGRWAELSPQIRASLDSFRNDSPSAREIPRGVAGAAVGTLAGALIASLAIWRRRRRGRQL
jgi:hypothetical protein